jgi:hypothetical protein
VDYIFIQSAAWFLGQDIIIVTTTSTEDHPYITISGNLIDEQIPCPGIPLTIGSKSNVHYQSLLPLEVRVPRNQIKPSSPVNTINMRVSSTISTEPNIFPKPDLDSKEEFPELKPSRSKRQVQPNTLIRKKEMEKSARQTGMIRDKEQLFNNHDKQRDNTKSPIQSNPNRVFKYTHQGKILNFEFMSDKRVRCPICSNEFKNMIRHLQQSGCRISNHDDLTEKFKQFSKVLLANQIKNDQNNWKAKSRAKQREVDDQQIKDDQNKWKAKSRSKQREGDVQQIKDDQNKWKAKSLAKQREADVQSVKDGQNKRKAKSVAEQRRYDDIQVKDDQNERKRKSRLGQRDVDNLKVLDNQKKWKSKSVAKQREVDNPQLKDDQNERKKRSRINQRDIDKLKVLDDQNNWKTNSRLVQ